MINKFQVFIIVGSLLILLCHSAAVTKQLEVSCPNGTAQINSWFWDGQKCESCSANCYCDASNKCTRCLKNNFAKVLKGSVYECIECPGHIEYQPNNDNEIYGSNYDLYLKDFWRNSDYNSYFNDANFQLIQKCYNQAEYLQIFPTSSDDILMGLQAITCNDQVKLSTGEVIYAYSSNALGSICWFLKGCKTYTPRNTTRVQGEGIIGICSTCQDGYYLNQYHGCDKCIAGCSTCAGEDVCSECQDGYWKVDVKLANMTKVKQQNNTLYLQMQMNQGKCLGCWDLYGKCEFRNNTIQHSKVCLSNTYYYHPVENKCKPCTINCQCQYSKSSSSGQECLNDTQNNYLCFNQFVQNLQQQKCIPCPTNCLKCQSSTSCEIGYCANGYRRGSSGSCVECEKGSRCKTSDSYQPIPTQCYTTNPSTNEYQMDEGTSSRPAAMKKNSFIPSSYDYYLFNGECVQNKYLCRKMYNSAGNCQTCYDGYYKTNLDKCEPIKANCLQMTAEGKCLGCRNGIDRSKDQSTVTNYFLSSNNETCNACIEGCKVCPDANICQNKQCQIGYYYYEQKCYKCGIENCMNCEDTIAQNRQVCSACFNGYRLWKNDKDENSMYYCEKCESNCLTCQNQRKLCTQCATGFYVQDGACLPIKRNCIKMILKNNIWQCQLCAYGYRIVDGRCMPCFSPVQGFINCPYSKKPSNYFYTNINVDAKDKENYNM